MKIGKLSDLRAAGYNPRRISDEALKGLGYSLKEFGDLSGIVFNTRTGNLVAGHQRVKALQAQYGDLAIEKGHIHANGDLFPVRLVDWPKEKELAANVAANSPTIQGEFTEDLQTLLDSIQVDLPEVFGNLNLDDLLMNLKDVELENKESDDFLDINEPEGIFKYSLDVMFKSTNHLGIPDLRSDKLINCPKPIETWAGENIKYDHNDFFLYNWRSDSIKGLNFNKTVLAFYVDDKRFEPLWTHTDIYLKKIIGRITIAISPNFSLWFGRPYAEQIWNTYRARWIGRYMQEAGLMLIPDVNFSDEKSFDFCFLGLPLNAPCISFQIQNIRTDEEKQRCKNGLLTSIHKLKPESIILYGNENKINWAMEFLPKIEIIPILNRSSQRRKIIERSW